MSWVSARMEGNNVTVTGFGEIAEQLRRSTVLVHAGGRGSGSGIIWSADGAVVTNAHVVRGSLTRVQLWDGRELEAKIMSRDARRDAPDLGAASDGYVFEEIGENLLALKRDGEAQPNFARAYALLKDDPSLQANDVARLERLRKLGDLQ